MQALVAINEIHAAQTPGVPATKDLPAVAPKVQVVPAGAAFFANSEDDEEFFLKVKAARLATEAEARELEETTIKAEPVVEKKAAKKAVDSGANLV